jgi:Molybdopterin converting factor, large subunit
MTLEHYPAMTEAELARIEAEANARWPLQASLIIHRYGTLKPGDNIVLVATASEHRDAAFAAAEFITSRPARRSGSASAAPKGATGSRLTRAMRMRMRAGRRPSTLPSNPPAPSKPRRGCV